MAIQTLQYLKGTWILELSLRGTQLITLVGFMDSDWANCLDTRQSVGRYTWSLESGIVSWSTRKQRTVMASSCGAEYIAVKATSGGCG